MIAAILIGRKGSTGLPGKNLMDVAGKPMAAWPLGAALATHEIDEVFVSTDDDGLVELASSMGAKLLVRSPELARNEALGEDVYVDCHRQIREINLTSGRDYELYVLLMANAVTVSVDQIHEGIVALRRDPTLDSAVTVSCYNMWSPLRARRITADGILEPFVPFETFGDPATLNCDRDSQGDVWFADMGVSIVRPANLDHLERGLLPQKWMGQRIHPIRNVGGLDVDFAYQLPQAAWWVENMVGRSG